MTFFKSFLKPSESVMISIATGALVYGVYQHNLPSVAEVHQTEPYNINVDAARKKAMWTSAAVVGGAVLLTKDPNVLIVGTGIFLILEWSHRHANSTHPNTGKMMTRSAVDAVSSGYAMQDYSTDVPDYIPAYVG